ncbi:MAG: NAD-dependent epimerase/dehydratase family protein [Dehalococcoidia bacterium]|nr:NAD-dependent epimerase/dehydratase family protein [Dehalococcoidia bacterium]
MSDVLVTGGYGVIGSQVMRQLVRENLRPVGMSRNPDLSFLADISEAIDVAKGDITNLDDILYVIERYRPTRIIHAANLIDAESDPYMGFQVGAVGTINMLEAAKQKGIRRFVFTSSKGVYGQIRSGEHFHPTYAPVTEDHVRNPENDLVYPGAKILGENVGVAYQKRYGLEFAALRFGHTWGPGKLVRHGILSLFSTLVENAMLGRPTKIKQGAEQKDDIVYIKDAAQGIVKACLADEVPSNFYNISSGRLTSVGEFAEALGKVVPGADVEIGPGLDYMGGNHPRYALFDISRARRELGYEPQYADLEAGIRDYLETMKAFGLQPIASM